MFQALTREQLGEIVELQLARLRDAAGRAGLSLELTDAAKELLAEAGWDPAYGARPLKRAIQRLVENPLALELLEGDFADGDTVRVDVVDGRARSGSSARASRSLPTSARKARPVPVDEGVPPQPLAAWPQRPRPPAGAARPDRAAHLPADGAGPRQRAAVVDTRLDRVRG